jgi:hypothetical protein
MEIEIYNKNEKNIAYINSNIVEIYNVQDAIDLMANCRYQGAESIIIHEGNITPDFFDLKSVIAGEVLQKFSNYRMKIAIIGDYSKYKSKSLRDFIFESNKMGRINFLNSFDEAMEKLSRQ